MSPANPKHRRSNRLGKEKSPYLLQHSRNPVDWFPWGEEALEKARQLDQPIFISIGYSTCHWCHVMAHETFEDEKIATTLNNHFVSIKVDREERPDLDANYMQACQLMSNQGGWPLNLFLTPGGKPFYALTYAPKESRYGHPGFSEILEKIIELWGKQRENLLSAGDQLSGAIRQLEATQQKIRLDLNILEEAARKFPQLYDPLHAGFGPPPKFPQPHNVSLLLRLDDLFPGKGLEQMALDTLRHIDQGGITDQLGGGLHRYSVDERWLVPHFEKMLYDQALISGAYLDAWQSSGDPQFRQAAKGILSYVLKELQHPEGGFFCGEDADSEGKEGTYYLWARNEIYKNLGAEDANLFCNCFNVSEEGNFDGENIPHLRQPISQLAAAHGFSPSEFSAKINGMRTILLRIRDQRPHPHLDDKILTGWNGLMIGSLARGGLLLSQNSYLEAAYKATKMLRSKMDLDGKLMRRYREGETAIDAFHEDYAFFIWGLIELFLADYHPDSLKLALSLEIRREDLFADGEGGYFDSTVEFVEGMGRGRNKQDGAIPAAASVTADNLIRLGRLTAEPELVERGKQLLSLQLSQAASYPTGHAFVLQALYHALIPQPLVMVITPPTVELNHAWQQVIKKHWPQPLTVITENPELLAETIPHLHGKSTLNGEVTAWVCTEQNCQLPATSPEELQKILKKPITP